LGKLNYFTMLLAPTGRAAKVISSYSKRRAFTIHKIIYTYKYVGGRNVFVLKKNTAKNTLFIVDEASMISDNSYMDKKSLLDDLMESKLVRIEKEYLARERLFHHGLRPKKKILLYGASGCGKSMAAERIAWDLGLPFYKVRFDSIISSYLGESASNLFQLLESIQNYACVLLLDEFDIIGKKRELSSKDIGEIHRIVNILLGLLEDYNGEGILIATTNLEGSLDNALFRRFDDIIKFEKPSKKEIERLLRQTLSALKIDQKVNLKTLSSKMEGFSYALIEKIANDAAKHSIIASKNNITLDDFKIAIKENSALVK